MKLKNKQMLSTISMVFFVLALSTSIVLFTVRSQNQKASYGAIHNTFKIIDILIKDLNQNLIDFGNQSVSSVKIKERLDFLNKYRKDSDSSMFRGSYFSHSVKSFQQLYPNALSNDITRLCFYDSTKELVLLLSIDKDARLFAYNTMDGDNPVFKFKIIGPNEELGNDPFQVLEENLIDPSITTIQTSKKILDFSETRFEMINNEICLVSYSPVVMIKKDRITKETEEIFLGTISVAKKLGQSFIEKIAQLSSNQVNLYSGKGLLAGTYPEVTQFDLNTIDANDKSVLINDKKIYIDNFDDNGNEFIQGVLPLKSSDKTLGAILAFYPLDIAKFNTLQMAKYLGWIFLICIMITIPIVTISSRTLTRSILQVMEGLKDISEGEGDLTKRIDVKSKDEVGKLANYFNNFIEKLQGIITEISDKADTLSESSKQMSQFSTSISTGASEMSDKSRQVASSSDEMSTSVNTIADDMEQALSNLRLVAAASEEMIATINEIAKNSEKARSITNEAVTCSGDASKNMEDLGVAAREIGNVTESISDISEQTNLLALNATIEAARAGEAGKGFAVVAGEIKELASQTAQATRNITEKVDSIQKYSFDSVSIISQINSIIGDINEIVATIASSLEEQSSTSQEIAKNITQVSSVIENVDEKVVRNRAVCEEIARDTGQIDKSTNEMSDQSDLSNSNSEELSVLANDLRKLVEKFKI